MRRCYYIKMNPSKVTKDEYNSIVVQYQPPLNQFVLDFVYDVEHHEITEISWEEFNRLLNS